MDLEYSIKITCAGTSVLRYINKNRNNRVKIIRRSEDLNHNPPVGFNFENVLLYIQTSSLLLKTPILISIIIMIIELICPHIM